MNLNTKLEVALDIMAAKIALESQRGNTPDTEIMRNLQEEKKKMYQCDEEILDKIIHVYGEEIKREHKES